MNPILVATVVCSHCRAEIDVQTETCPHCGTAQRANPGTSRATGSADEQQRVLDRPWVIVLLLLHVGFLGIPIYWKTSYSVGTRLMICLLSVAYTIFAVGVIVGVGAYLYRQLGG